MKRLISLFLAMCVAICLCACVPEKESYSSEYDGKEISKIEASWSEGFAPFPCLYTRTFDFESGIVTDTWVADEEYLYGDELEQYNNPEVIATFTAEQGKELIDKITALGFLTWEKQYITKDIIHDGGSKNVRVYFTDGVEKSTYIYFKYPANYNKICEAFENNFGVSMYLTW